MKTRFSPRSFKRAFRLNFSVVSGLALLASSLVALSPIATAPASAANQIQKQTGFNARAWSVTSPDSQGIRYIGGDFTSYQAWDTGSAAAVSLSTGEVDARFPKVSGWPYQKAVVSDGAGGWYIGGGISSVGGVSVSRVAHLQANGTLNTSWMPSITGGQGVLTLAKFGDVIILGGSFTAVNGTPRNRVAAIKTDGTLLDWNPNANNIVHTIRVSGENAYITGQLTNLAGSSRNLAGAVRLGNRTDAPGETCLTAWSNADCLTAWNPNVSGWGILDIAVDSTYTYLTGHFDFVGGQARKHAAKVLTSDGALQAWNPAINSQGGGLAIANGKVYLGGQFSTAGGQPRSKIASWDITTDALEDWAPNITGNGVNAIVTNGNKIFFGGKFSMVDSEGRNHAAAADRDGNLLDWDPHVCDQVNGVPSAVHGMAATDSQVYLLGDFNCMGGQKRIHAAAVNAAGLLTDWAPVINGPVSTFSRTGSTIYIGGNFSNINGQTRNGAGAVDTEGVVTAWNPNPDGRAATIVATPTKIYMGGWFNNVAGTPRPNLAVLDPITGALDLSFNAELNGAVRTMSLNGNDLFIGGNFSSVGGEPHFYIASINATTAQVNSAFTARTGTGAKTHPFLEAIAVVGDKVFIGGYFGEVNGEPRTFLAALDRTSGALVPNWNAVVNRDVYAIAASTDGSVIYVGGNGITATSGLDSAQGVVAINVETGEIDSWRANTGEVRGISVSDAAVFIAGNFSDVGGQARQNTAAVGTSGAVLEPWPMNPSTAVTLDVTIPDDGPGAVTSDPGGINCGDSCAYSFSIGSSVTLTAVPEPGFELDSWAGECTGRSSTCTLTLAQAASAVATFRVAGSVSDPTDDQAGNETPTPEPPAPEPSTPEPSTPEPSNPGAPAAEAQTPTVEVTPTAPTEEAAAETLTTESFARSVLFAPGSSKLDASDRRVLNRLISLAKPLSDLRVTVSGSAQKTNFSRFDKVLATARAKSVVAYLKSQGIKATFVVLPAEAATDSSFRGRSATATITGNR